MLQWLHNTDMDKASKVNAILIAMQAAYEREGVEGDFADAHRYYMSDASEDEIDYDYAKWCPNA